MYGRNNFNRAYQVKQVLREDLEPGSRLIRPEVAPDADPRYVPGVVLHVVAPTSPPAPGRVLKYGTKSLCAINSDWRKAKRDKEDRHRRCEERKAATAQRMAPLWDSQKAIIAGFDLTLIPVQVMSALLRISLFTINSRVLRMGLTKHHIAPPPHQSKYLVALTLEDAYRVITFNPGHRKGWGNNPKRKLKPDTQQER